MDERSRDLWLFTGINMEKTSLLDLDESEILQMAFPRQKLYPLVKWAGGKEKELKYIFPNLPKHFENYYEPFVGGGAVYTAIQANKYLINDKSRELIYLYKCIAGFEREVFFKLLDEIINHWDLLPQFTKRNYHFFSQIYSSYVGDEIDDFSLNREVKAFVRKHDKVLCAMFPKSLQFNMDHFLDKVKVNLSRKIKRMKTISIGRSLVTHDIFLNTETALKSAFYMHIRYLYNHSKMYSFSLAYEEAFFLFIRNFAYCGMFRYNASGEFNVPYGGSAYNRKKLKKKVAYLKTAPLRDRLQNTIIENLDFEVFLKRYEPKKNDFVFFDPPYDSEFSTYAQNEFNKTDQVRLSSYLLKRCKAQWMMIVKNTDFIYSLYANKGLKIKTFGKQYLVSFMNRNDKKTEHLLITNYWSFTWLGLPSLYVDVVYVCDDETII